MPDSPKDGLSPVLCHDDPPTWNWLCSFYAAAAAAAAAAAVVSVCLLRKSHVDHLQRSAKASRDSLPLDDATRSVVALYSHSWS
jgi:hypothetical protein